MGKTICRLYPYMFVTTAFMAFASGNTGNVLEKISQDYQRTMCIAYSYLSFSLVFTAKTESVDMLDI